MIPPSNLIFSYCFSSEGNLNVISNFGVPLATAEKWQIRSLDATHWWISEKLDGIRAYWDGRDKLYALSGDQILAPASFTNNLPRIPLDGQLWCGKGKFEECCNIVFGNNNSEQSWKEVSYQVFDAPSQFHIQFEERMENLRRRFPLGVSWGNANLVVSVKCKGKSHLLKTLADFESQGGEGIILRKPQSSYFEQNSLYQLQVIKIPTQE